VAKRESNANERIQKKAKRGSRMRIESRPKCHSYAVRTPTGTRWTFVLAPGHLW